MAKWRLRTAHYLAVPDTKWVYEETSRETGELNRQEFPVPRLIDPADPRCCDANGDCVVFSGPGPRARGLWPFLGDPTPEMEPLDDEAEAISAALRPRWENPIESLPANGGMTPAEQAFMENMMKAFAGANKSVSQDEVEGLKKRLDELAEQNAKLIAALEAKQPSASGLRRN